MRYFLILPALAAALASGAGAQGAPPSSLRTATTELGRSLVAAHATLDGAPITGLRQTGRCEAVITTARGGTPVRWRDLGNFAPRLMSGRTIIGLPAGGRTHVISARTGKDATGINMGLGLLDEECGGV